MDKMEQQHLKEEADLLINIRNDLSDIDFAPGFSDASIHGPEGIYEMVMELKRMYQERQDFLIRFFAENGGGEDIDVKLWLEARDLLGGQEAANKLYDAYEIKQKKAGQ